MSDSRDYASDRIVELETELSAANAKIAKLEKERGVLRTCFAEASQLAGPAFVAHGELARLRQQNLELAATVARLQITGKNLTRYLATRDDDTCVGLTATMPPEVLEDFDTALSLTPSSVLLAHDLELAERAFIEGCRFLAQHDFNLEEAKEMWLASQSRRSITL